MTRSHLPALSVWRMNPRRCEFHVYRTEAFRSLATTWAILFSNPSSWSFENGRLSGSAQTRNSRGGSAAPATADSIRARAVMLADRVMLLTCVGTLQSRDPG